MTTLAGIILIGGFALLMLLRVPVSFAMLLSTLASALVMDTNLSVMIRQMMDGANNFSLLSIPFFIVMGEFMGAGGISEKIVGLANLVVGRFRGGLAYVNVLDSMFFGGISGSAVADVSSLGSMVIPMMKKQGYDEDFAVGLTVTTACQGVLIPPSHNMVIYALAAGPLVADGDHCCCVCHICHSFRSKSPWTPPVFLIRRMSVMTMSFCTALHISYTVKAAVLTAVRASISTPVRPSQETVA